MIEDLDQGHEIMKLSVCDAMKAALKGDDIPTVSVLAARLNAHEGHSLKLMEASRLLKNTNISQESISVHV
jgi:hypothetical protein